MCKRFLFISANGTFNPPFKCNCMSRIIYIQFSLSLSLSLSLTIDGGQNVCPYLLCIHTQSHASTYIDVKSTETLAQNSEHRERHFCCAADMLFIVGFSFSFLVFRFSSRFCVSILVYVCLFMYSVHLYTRFDHVHAIFFKLPLLFAVWSKFYCYLYCILCAVISKHICGISRTCPMIMFTYIAQILCSI